MMSTVHITPPRTPASRSVTSPLRQSVTPRVDDRSAASSTYRRSPRRWRSSAPATSPSIIAVETDDQASPEMSSGLLEEKRIPPAKAAQAAFVALSVLGTIGYTLHRISEWMEPSFHVFDHDTKENVHFCQSLVQSHDMETCIILHHQNKIRPVRCQPSVQPKIISKKPK